MKFKKFLSMVACAAMCLCLAACSNATTSSTDSGSDNTDWAYIQNKGEMIVGITLYEPMNYYDENDVLTGFETEFTTAVCEKLGVTPKFQVIEWTQKESELKSKTIDVIWNGLTVDEERKQNMAFSTSYIKNRQVLVIKKDNAEKFTDTASLAGANVTAESSSAGEKAIQSDENLSKAKFVGVSAQKDTLIEVKSGTSDAAVIDYVMATASIGEGTDFDDLMILEGVELAAEEYAVGVRLEDKEFLSKINGAIDELVQDGSLKKLAEKYGLADVYAFDN